MSMAVSRSGLCRRLRRFRVRDGVESGGAGRLRVSDRSPVKLRLRAGLLCSEPSVTVRSRAPLGLRLRGGAANTAPGCPTTASLPRFWLRQRMRCCSASSSGSSANTTFCPHCGCAWGCGGAVACRGGGGRGRVVECTQCVGAVHQGALQQQAQTPTTTRTDPHNNKHRPPQQQAQTPTTTSTDPHNNKHRPQQQQAQTPTTTSTDPYNNKHRAPQQQAQTPTTTSTDPHNNKHRPLQQQAQTPTTTSTDPHNNKHRPPQQQAQTPTTTSTDPYNNAS